MKAELTAFASYLSEYLGYNLADLQKKSRNKELVRPRQQIMAYLHSVKNGTVRNENISEIFNQGLYDELMEQEAEEKVEYNKIIKADLKKLSNYILN